MTTIQRVAKRAALSSQMSITEISKLKKANDRLNNLASEFFSKFFFYHVRGQLFTRTLFLKNKNYPIYFVDKLYIGWIKILYLKQLLSP